MDVQRSVQDTIPGSHLAEYGLFLYDEVRESCYTMEFPPREYINEAFSKEEAWMTEEVDRIFNVITNPNSQVKEIEKTCAYILREVEEHERRLNEKESQLNKKHKENDNDNSLNMHLRHLWEPPPSSVPTHQVPTSVLNVDVPEFYPKVHKQHQEFYLPENIVNEPGGYHLHHRHMRRDYGFASTLHSPLYEPWLTYGYPVRAHEFRGLDSLVDGLRLLPTPLLVSAPSPTPLQMPTRRLYSAVLQNSPPSAVDEDELERQAMEQYRRSEETIAAQYQELERLAEEQYNGCSSESCSGLSGNGSRPRRKLPPSTVGRHACHPALAAQLFANALLAIAKLKFMRLGRFSSGFCHF